MTDNQPQSNNTPRPNLTTRAKNWRELATARNVEERQKAENSFRGDMLEQLADTCEKYDAFDAHISAVLDECDTLLDDKEHEIALRDKNTCESEAHHVRHNLNRHTHTFHQFVRAFADENIENIPEALANYEDTFRDGIPQTSNLLSLFTLHDYAHSARGNDNIDHSYNHLLKELRKSLKALNATVERHLSSLLPLDEKTTTILQTAHQHLSELHPLMEKQLEDIREYISECAKLNSHTKDFVVGNVHSQRTHEMAIAEIALLKQYSEECAVASNTGAAAHLTDLAMRQLFTAQLMVEENQQLFNEAVEAIMTDETDTLTEPAQLRHQLSAIPAHNAEIMALSSKTNRLLGNVQKLLAPSVPQQR